MVAAADRGRSTAICWFRRDLRLGDNPAWDAACDAADLVVAVFVLDPRLFASAGRHRQTLLRDHLRCLDETLSERGGRLRVISGDATTAIPALALEVGADVVTWNSDCTPFAVKRDAVVAQRLSCPHETYWGTVVHRPGSVLTAKGTLSRVFTPFYKRWAATPWDEWPSASVRSTSRATVASDPGEGVPPGSQLPTSPDSAGGGSTIAGGEAAAHERLREAVDRVDDYLDTRDLPAVDGTSMLSADLRFGTLSPRHAAGVLGDASAGRRGLVRQLAWRDWYAHLLLENPSMPRRALRPAYDSIAWVNDNDDFDSWCRGQTGYPIVDAGMRQMAATGWMHNRVRMIAASFLVKDLLVDWRRGERFFRRHLIDGDVAQNAGNWQWVAGTGPDAAPYFRVFNPVTQSRKFDARGDYIRRWVPELADLADKMLHAPWEAAPLDLAAAGIILGDTYPHPIIDHGFARERVLAVYKAALSEKSG